MMGNPNAKVKLVEIGSLSCPHCKEFDDEGVADADRKICEVGQGQLGIPALHHPRADRHGRQPRSRAATALKSFFPLTRALYKDQAVWMAKIQAVPQDKIEQIQNLPTNQVFVQMASLLGLQDWAAARGVPQAKSNQCLADQKMIDQRGADTSDVSNQYPEFSGTPAFIINGKMLEDTRAGRSFSRNSKEAMK